ncbi:hypothetical protein [Novosphingobium resinovorum]|uniref:hypothetical protein n=1 Tax=Novosphingobium resinovorum TaxID=158500 RepID=UPI002ED41779
MRMHMNQPLLAAKGLVAQRAANVARERTMTDHPKFPADAASIQEQQDKLDRAIAELVAIPAHNGIEILMQLEAMLDRTDEWMCNGGAFEQALTAAARPQPSAPMISAFASFRAAWVTMSDYDNASTHTDKEALRLQDVMSDASDAVFAVGCATAGDFVVKAYVNLLWHAGHTAASNLPNGETGSFFDIALSQIDSDSKFTDAYYRSVYDDLDHSDLGACLLATGNIDFDPLGWVERADTIGMPVSVIVRADGTKSLNFGFIDSDDDRLRREERRLQQMLTFDHRARWHLLADFIVSNRPALVFAAPEKAAA